MAYAEKTAVPIEKSVADIQRLIMQHGAAEFGQGTNQKSAVVQFSMNCRRIRFVIPMPDPKSNKFTQGRGYRTLSASESQRKFDQACRQKFRALYLCIKAKLESVESGIAEFEEEFLAHIVLPNGQTVGEYTIPQIAQAYEQQVMPPMLPFLQ